MASHSQVPESTAAEPAVTDLNQKKAQTSPLPRWLWDLHNFTHSHQHSELYMSWITPQVPKSTAAEPAATDMEQKKALMQYQQTREVISNLMDVKQTQLQAPQVFVVVFTIFQALINSLVCWLSSHRKSKLCHGQQDSCCSGPALIGYYLVLVIYVCVCVCMHTCVHARVCVFPLSSFFFFFFWKGKGKAVYACV